MNLADFALPSLNEPMPAIRGEYTKPHTHAWATKIVSFEAYVFMTPEYNHSTPGPLKNAIDFLYAGWINGHHRRRAGGDRRAEESGRQLITEDRA